MFGISGEHLLVLLVILLIFGPKRLPDLGNSLGRTLRNFKDAMNNNADKSAAQPIAPQQAAPAPQKLAPPQGATSADAPAAAPQAAVVENAQPSAQV